MENVNDQLTEVASGPRSATLTRLLFQRRSGGQAIVILALFMMFLIGISGIVYDLGLARDEAAKAQRAADAAALAGVVFMPEHFQGGNTTANATDAAQKTAGRHGYTDLNNITVSEIPQHPAQLQVDIASVYTTTFMRVFGLNTVPVHVTAIAEYNHPITMGAPEPYLGVGSNLAQARSADPSMRMQGFWLSLHSPGTPKENGDPWMAKWDYTGGGCPNCFPVGGQFQPDHDNNGYSFGLYVGPGDNPDLQIYDPAYQPKPGNAGVQNFSFSQAHPCNTSGGSPSSCHNATYAPPNPPPSDYRVLQLDYNNIYTRWCASNNTDTGDNQPGPASQCDPQAAGATAVYTLYYPDSTPWYFDDDQVADSWTVAASPITGTNDGNPNHIVPSYAYSQTWTNYKNQSGGYQLYVYQNNHQWRLQVNVPNGMDSATLGVQAQNNFGIRLQNAHNTQTLVYAIQRLPVLATINAGKSDFYLADVGVENAGKTLVVSLFDPGDANGTNYISLLAPPDATIPYSHPVNIDYYVHDGRSNPPGADQVYINYPNINATRPTYNFNDEWIDVLYRIPQDTTHGGTYVGGFFVIRYDYTQQTQDRTAWRISIRGNPVHLVLGGG